MKTLERKKSFEAPGLACISNRCYNIWIIHVCYKCIEYSDFNEWAESLITEKSNTQNTNKEILVPSIIEPHHSDSILYTHTSLCILWNMDEDNQKTKKNCNQQK